MSENRKRIITVFGTSNADENDAIFKTGIQLGKMLAEANFIIANGGYGGTMLAVAKGAACVGGKVYGVTCTAFKRGKANEFVSDEISTDTLNRRLAKLVELGDAYVVLPGATGTLLELAWVWEHKNKRFENADKPIVILGAFWKPLIEIMAKTDSRCENCVYPADTPRQAVEYLKQYFASIKN